MDASPTLLASTGPAEFKTLLTLVMGMDLAAISSWADGYTGALLLAGGVAIGVAGGLYALVARRPATGWAAVARDHDLTWQSADGVEWLRGRWGGRNITARIHPRRVDITCAPFRSLEPTFPTSPEALALMLKKANRGMRTTMSLDDALVRAVWQSALDDGLQPRGLAGQVCVRCEGGPEALPAALDRAVELCRVLDSSALKAKADTLF
jgi:hypothetical protein